MSNTIRNRVPVHVAVAAVNDARGRILITRRADHAHQGGLWEFPGGKVEPGETTTQALQRELLEELGIRALGSEPLIRVVHHYTDRSVLLDVYRVSAYSGVAEGREGQPWRWVLPETLGDFAFPAADGPIITALCLPDRYLITGDDPGRPTDFIASLERALDTGIVLVQLRAKSLAAAEYRNLARCATALCEGCGAKLLLNGPLELTRSVCAHGLHLSSAQLMGLSERPLDQDRLIGASCHTLDELARAQRLGLDFAVLSPVRSTLSHPWATPLGWDGFRHLVEQSAIPIYALGGMRPADLVRAKTAGAQGIAAIRGLWPAPTGSDPA